jgi:hypothetical protein
MSRGSGRRSASLLASAGTVILGAVGDAMQLPAPVYKHLTDNDSLLVLVPTILVFVGVTVRVLGSHPMPRLVGGVVAFGAALFWSGLLVWILLISIYPDSSIFALWLSSAVFGLIAAITSLAVPVARQGYEP